MVQAVRKTLVSPELRQILQISWIVLIVVFVGYYLWRNWLVFASYNWHFSIWWVFVAIMWAMIRRLLGGIRWVLIALYDQSNYERKDVFNHLQVYFLSSLAIYLPGGLWYMASRIQMSKEKGLSTLAASVGLLYETGLLVWSGCIVGAYIAVVIFPFNALNIVLFTVFLVFFSLFLIHPKVANFTLNYILRVLKRPPASIEVTFGWGIQLWLVSLGVWIAGGLSLFYILKAFYPTLETANLLGITSASALAWTIGFLTPWAPSGFGVREGLLVWLLGIYVSNPVAVVGSLAARLVTIVEDITWAGIVLLVRRR